MVLRVIGIVCLALPGIMILGLSYLFLARRDAVWRLGRRMEGMIPEDYERTPRWDRQMLFVGTMFLVIGALCLGLSLIGIFFS